MIVFNQLAQLSLKKRTTLLNNYLLHQPIVVCSECTLCSLHAPGIECHGQDRQMKSDFHYRVKQTDGVTWKGDIVQRGKEGEL